MKNQAIKIIAPFFVFVFLSIGISHSAAGEPLHEKLNGTWQSDTMTATFDFNKGIYSGIVLGQIFSRKLTLISEEANVVVFKSNDSKIVCQFQSNGSIILTKEGGIPITLTRANQ